MLLTDFQYKKIPAECEGSAQDLDIRSESTISEQNTLNSLYEAGWPYAVD